jgi:hypothetical protein
MLRFNHHLNKLTNVRHMFSYKDPFLLEKQLSDDEKAIKEVAYNFSKDHL